MTRNKKLSNYLKCAEANSLSVIDFINQNPDCFLDVESCSEFLYSDTSEESKLKNLQIIFEIKEREEENRPRIKGQKYDSYGEYLSVADDDVLCKEDFELIYHSVDKLPLSNNELDCSQKSMNAIAQLKQINESREDILRFIGNYSSNPSKFKIENLKDLSRVSFDKKMDIINAYSKATGNLDGSYNTIIDALCYNELDLPFDYVLENKTILQRFSVSFNNSQSIKNPLLIVCPTTFFVRKWIATNPAFNRKTIFCLPDDSLKDIIASKITNNNIFFINFAELESFLNSSYNIPTNTLFFGNHFTDPKKKYELFKTITEHVYEKSSLQYYDLDWEITNKNSLINHELASRDSIDIDINRIYLLPARNNNNIKYKRTILVDFEYGYINNAHNSISLFKYEIKRNYNIPYISSNIFQTSIPKSDFFNEGSLRKYYHDEKQINEKKTDKTKVASAPIRLSDEITFMFSFNDNGPRKRTSCYFIHDGKEVAGTRQSPTTFKTRDEALYWATDIYPFSSSEKGVPIQEVVNNVLKEELKNTRICLSTVIYINYNLFCSLPIKLQEEMKYLIHSDMGCLYIDQLSQEYLLDFLQKEYTYGQRNVSLNAVLSALSHFYEFAIANGNTTFNTASSLLQELRKNSRNIELFEVRNALTLKNLYIEEMNFVFYGSVNNLEKDPSFSLATIIRLITALEPNIVDALLWKDFISFNKNGETIYQLVIRRELNNEGDEFLHFEKKYQNRIVPLPTTLSSLLIKEKEKQLKDIALGNLEYLNECTIINGNDHVINGQCRILSPMRLYEHNRKLFLNKKLDGRIIEVPDNKGGTIETNIDYYQGDIFRSNLRHYYLTMNYGFSFNQAMYLLGNKASNTFYSNYFDFMNEISQYNLYKKINAMWEDILK